MSDKIKIIEWDKCPEDHFFMIGDVEVHDRVLRKDGMLFIERIVTPKQAIEFINITIDLKPEESVSGRNTRIKMEKVKTPEDQAKEAKNQLKKLMDSHMLILEHRMGRPPTMDELMNFINEGGEQKEEAPQAKEALTKPVVQEPEELPGNKPQEPAAEIEAEEHRPRIVDTQVYYGMSGEGENRKPDPFNILFYKTPDDRWYQTASQEWFDQEPSYASHLPCRGIVLNDKDLVSAIAHGILDDFDFEALEKAGFIKENSTPHQVWHLKKRLHSLHQQHEQLTKSDDVESKESEEPSEDKKEEPKDDQPKEKKEEKTESKSEGGEETSAGEDLISQIMEAALAAVDAGMETKVSDIVTRLLKQHNLIKDQADHPPNGTEPDL